MRGFFDERKQLSTEPNYGPGCHSPSSILNYESISIIFSLSKNLKMKKATIASFATFVFFFILLWNPSFLYTETGIPSGGNTGAPGEQTCGQGNCHVGNAENLEPGKLVLNTASSQNPITAGYKPDTLHKLFVNLNSGTPAYGFQITALDQNNNAAGTFSLISTSTTDLLTQGGRQYLSHKNANSTAAWTFNWKAPATDIGPITFYYTGLGANDDNQATGDVVYRGRAVVTTSSFSQLNLTNMPPINADEITTLKIFPNPMREKLNIEFFLHSENQVTIELFDVGGKVVKRIDEYVGSPGVHQRSFSFEEKLNQGIYLLKVTEGERVYFKKLMTS
jgi:hypothetical protein